MVKQYFEPEKMVVRVGIYGLSQIFFYNFSLTIMNKLKAKEGPPKSQKCQLYLPILCCTPCICPYLKLIKKRLGEQTAGSVITKEIENYLWQMMFLAII